MNVYKSRKFKRKVKNKATRSAPGMFIYTPYRLLAGNLRVACWESLMVAVANIYNIGVGLSALLVSTFRAMREP